MNAMDVKVSLGEACLRYECAWSDGSPWSGECVHHANARAYQKYLSVVIHQTTVTRQTRRHVNWSLIHYQFLGINITKNYHNLSAS